MNAKDATPSQELHSREALAPVFAALNQYAATTHFLGQHTVLTMSDDHTTGEAYCLAHHVTVDGGTRRLMVASLRYLDSQSRQRFKTPLLWQEVNRVGVESHAPEP